MDAFTAVNANPYAKVHALSIKKIMWILCAVFHVLTALMFARIQA